MCKVGVCASLQDDKSTQCPGKPVAFDSINR